MSKNRGEESNMPSATCIKFRNRSVPRYDEYRNLRSPGSSLTKAVDGRYSLVIGMYLCPSTFQLTNWLAHSWGTHGASAMVGMHVWTPGVFGR